MSKYDALAQKAVEAELEPSKVVEPVKEPAPDADPPKEEILPGDAPGELDAEGQELVDLFSDDPEAEVGDPPAKPEPTKVEDKVPEKEPEPEKVDNQEPDPKVPPPEDKKDEASLQLPVDAPVESDAPQQSAEELQKQREEWREKMSEQLEKHFAGMLTEDDARDLISEPEKVLPKMFARSYLDMYDSIMAGMAQQMPNQVQNLISAQKQAVTAESTFYDRWPQLKEAKGDTVMRTIQAYRQLNPEASLQQTVEEAGAMAMVALRMPLEPDKPPVQADKVIPFTPAPPGSSKPAPKQKKQTEFEILAQELIDDEDM